MPARSAPEAVVLICRELESELFIPPSHQIVTHQIFRSVMPELEHVRMHHSRDQSRPKDGSDAYHDSPGPELTFLPQLTKKNNLNIYHT
jgi:hypothetical protein